MTDNAIPVKSRELMNGLAHLLNSAVKPYAFALLVFDSNDDETLVNYISNASRTEMVKALEEFIARQKRAACGAPTTVQ